jgi:beta-galactosidase
MNATVEVYSRAAEVELYLGGRSVGRKKTSKTARTLFKVPYDSADLTAVSYDAAGRETGRYTLHPAGNTTVLQILPEEETATAGRLAFIRLRYTDEDGVWKPLERSMLKVEVEGGELLGLGSANSYVRGNYTTDTTDTYYGEALAIVRAGEAGEMKISVTEEVSDRVTEAVIPVVG